MSSYKIKKALKPYKTAILSVFISVFAISGVSVASMAGKAEIAKELDGVGLNGMSVKVYNAQNENITDTAVYEILAEWDSIDLVTPVLYQGAQVEFAGGNKHDVMCWGISAMAKDIVNLDLVHGRMLSESDTQSKNLVCMIDENIALEAYSRANIVGKSVFISVGGRTLSFEIIGVVNKTSNVLNGLSGDFIPNFIYIPYTTMESITGRNNIDQILINVTGKEIRDKQVENYIKKSAVTDNDIVYKISNLARQRDTINNIVDIAFGALFIVSCVAIVVCSISVATAVGTAVTHAKHDIGIKISLGAGRLNIMSEFLLYSSLACAIGIALGMAAGIILLAVVNLYFQKGYTFDYMLLKSGIFATMGLTVIFSLFPSFQAASMLPIKALNRE